jgi:hypothetical protein
LGLPSKKNYLKLILDSAGLAYRQGPIKDMQQLSRAGGRKSAVISAARRCAP